MQKLALLLVFISYAVIGQADPEVRIHSHNDYLQNVPFWKAMASGASSIEADVFLVGDSLYVAHTEEEIDTERSLKRLYLDPLREAMALGFERPTNLQLLIDIKSEARATLDAVIGAFKDYPEIVEDETITIAISGNRPEPSDYPNYPDFIYFDHQGLEPIENPSILKKIALISLSFRNFSKWNGKGPLTSDDLKKVSTVIQKAHGFGKPFRFWATPDSKTAWKAFADLGVDFINTDRPFACADFLEISTDKNAD